MARTLILARHAAPDRDHRRYTDHAFPLTRRGHDEARTLGQLLHERLGGVDTLYSSNATRARETSQRILEHLSAGRVVERPDLYLPSVGDILTLITELGQEEHTVLVVAHEPGVSLATEALAIAHPCLFGGFPTAGAAILSVDGEWTDLSHGLARHEFLSGGDQF